MTQEQFDEIKGMLTAIANAVQAKWESGLVGTGQPQSPAPEPKEVAADPGKYYGTAADILSGYVTAQGTIDMFSPPIGDGEGGVIRKFVGGTMYDWARADLSGFLAYFRSRYGASLNLAKLHPDQRSRIGL